MNRKEFELFLQSSHFSVFNKIGTLRYKGEGNKISVVVSSKHEKSAVIRNKVKRRAYTVFSKKNTENSEEKKLSAILYLSKGAYTLPDEVFYNELDQLFKRAYANLK